MIGCFYQVPTRFTVKAALFLCLPLLLTSCFSDSKRAKKQVILAVNEYELTAKEFADDLARELRIFDAATLKSSSIQQTVKDRILRQFTVQALSQKWARENQITISEEEVLREVEKLRQSYPDDFSFRNALASQNISLEEWKEKSRRSLIERRVQEALLKKEAPPTPQQIEEYYQAHKASFRRPAQIRLKQILVESADEAYRLEKLLKDKGDFASLAKKYSIGPERVKGGDVGWVDKGQFEVYDKVFTFAVGKISGVLKTSYGYHLLMVSDRRAEKNLELSEVKDRIVTMLMGDKAETISKNWLENQIKSAKVVRNDALISSLVVETRGP